MNNSENPLYRYAMTQSRRRFFSTVGKGIGVAALSSLLGENGYASDGSTESRAIPFGPHFAPKAKRVIYLFQSGGRHSWICSITSPIWTRFAGMICPTLFAWASG